MKLFNIDLKIFGVCDYAYTEEAQSLTFSKYEEWVTEGLAGPLNYLTDHRKNLRSDLKAFYPSFKSALVFLFDYSPNKNEERVASYVSGFDDQDYHFWIKDKLTKISEKLKQIHPNLECTYSIDAQPVLERDLAYRSGLGWFGKNSMLINRKHGSYFLISSILLNQTFELELKPVESDHCGNCRACIDACPTDALIETQRVLDASKCISTFTIELFKDAEAPKGYEKNEKIYGCDICQEVCPWNKKIIKTTTESSSSLQNFFKQDINVIVDELEGMSNREFRRRFKGTPLERTGRVGVLKNLKPFKD